VTDGGLLFTGVEGKVIALDEATGKTLGIPDRLQHQCHADHLPTRAGGTEHRFRLGGNQARDGRQYRADGRLDVDVRADA
jgi:hypothetical protein